ncbi:MAG TPA: RNA 2',3'-cyclic phosphodiesterase, partial [Gemmatimonadales bacterium]|nr:RNA 2',3'-cyclic phosphodiesterase [Gemmatimonadales bacterium]
MRLFAALPLPAPVLDALVATQAGWREAGWPVRWVGAESLHVTVRFFGEVEPEREPSVRAMLDEAARGTGMLVLNPVAMRTFPAGRRARLVWLELAPEPALELLAHRVERGAAALGFEPAHETFRPHVTLARVRKGERLPAEAARRVAAGRVPGPFTADGLVLFESRPGAN